TAVPTRTARLRARRESADRRRVARARRSARWRSATTLISVLLLLCAECDPEEDTAAGEERQQDRHVEDAQHEPGIRDPQRLGPDDVVVRRVPEIWRSPVVALHPPALRAIAADDPVDHDVPRTDLALRHAVGNDLADVVARPVLDEDEVAG